MKGKASKSYILLGVCYKLPNHDGKFISSVFQDGEINEAFQKQLTDIM